LKEVIKRENNRIDRDREVDREGIVKHAMKEKETTMKE